MSTDFLEAIEAQLVAATERGINRRRWRWPWLMQLRLPVRAPSVGIAAGVGAALAASAIAATITIPASRPRAHAVTATPRVRSYRTAGTVPVGFEPRSFTAISEFTWWLLGTAPCGSGQCTAIVRTTDGGRTFTRLAAPPTTRITNIRFADPLNGYAYGPTLWSTHDGGLTWTQAPLGAGDLAIADGYAYAITSTGRAIPSLMRSPVGTDAWQVPPGLAGRPGVSAHGFSGLWVEGPTVIVQAGPRLLVSTDQGTHFRARRGVPHAGNCSYDGGPLALWALCSTGMAPDVILLSHDLGATFTAAAPVPDGPIGTFAGASGTVAVASGQGPLYRTVDAGASWTPVAAPSANWTYLGFTDSTHGVAIGEFGGGGHQRYRLYYTTDAGASYHLVTIAP